MSLLVLIVAYALVVALLLLLLIKTPCSWQTKLVMIMIGSSFYVLTWEMWGRLTGWPSEQTLPPTFRLIAQHIVQPNKQTGQAGAIYVWVVDWDSQKDKEMPRAYRLPYSEQLHIDVSEATGRSNPQKGMLIPTGDSRGGSWRLQFEDIIRSPLPVKR